MYTLWGNEFINMIKEFYPLAKIASGGREIVLRCKSCGDSDNPKHAHLYIKVPQSDEEVPLYNCKKCNASGIVDDLFLRRYGCEDTRVMIDLATHNEKLKSSLRFVKYKNSSKYYLNNIIFDDKYNTYKLNYINSRIGSNFTIDDIRDLKIFLNLIDILRYNNITPTRDQRIIEGLNTFFIGFISYDNSYAIMRKVVDKDIGDSKLDKRYINYKFVEDYETVTFYTIPAEIDSLSNEPINIHIAEGVFDILSIYYNLNNRNNKQNIYITAAGKSYKEALKFVLTKIGMVNFIINLYPDNDVHDRDLYKLILKDILPLQVPIFIHRNLYPNEKDFGVPLDRININSRRAN